MDKYRWVEIARMGFGLVLCAALSGALVACASTQTAVRPGASTLDTTRLSAKEREILALPPCTDPNELMLARGMESTLEASVIRLPLFPPPPPNLRPLKVLLRGRVDSLGKPIARETVVEGLPLGDYRNRVLALLDSVHFSPPVLRSGNCKVSGSFRLTIEFR